VGAHGGLDPKRTVAATRDGLIPGWMRSPVGSFSVHDIISQILESSQNLVPRTNCQLSTRHFSKSHLRLEHSRGVDERRETRQQYRQMRGG
jgi:hypothetical protein